MELDKFCEEQALAHNSISLNELSNPDNFERWKNGERAREQAKLIVDAVIAAAMKDKQQRSKIDEA